MIKKREDRMKHQGVLLAGILIAALLAIHCGDECVECPPPATGPSLYALGEISVDPPYNVAVSIDVRNVAGNDDKVESAFLDGEQLCIRTLPEIAAGDGRQIIRWVGQDEWCPSGVIMPFTATDTTTLTLNCNGAAHTTYLHLLDDDGDMPEILTVAAYTGGTLYVGWSEVPGAEWYSVRVRSDLNITWYYSWEFHCVDTTSIILPMQYDYEDTEEIRVYVAAGCGPIATESGFEHNLSGPHIIGSIYSVSNSDYHYMSINPLAADAEETTGRYIEPPSIAEILRMHRERSQ